MPTSCEINLLNNDAKVYHAGQLLSGTLSLKLTSEKSVRGVYVEIYGKAYAHWTESKNVRRDGKNQRVTKSYTGEEDYLKEITYFIGDGSGNS